MLLDLTFKIFGLYYNVPFFRGLYYAILRGVCRICSNRAKRVYDLNKTGKKKTEN